MKLSVYEIVIFGLLGALMYVSKLVMEFAPNIHLLSAFTIAFTLAYRKKALYPIYTFVLIQGIMAGFALWWIPYLYIWTVLWGAAMLLPRNMKPAVQTVVCCLLCSAHGFLYGTLYAPAQALMFGLNFEGMIAWIIAGFPFDLIHGVSNLFCGLLIMPVVKVLKRAERGYRT